MLVRNKSDRVSDRQVSREEGSALVRELGCEFVEISAKNCLNVEKAFFDVVRQLRRQRQVASNPTIRPSVARTGPGGSSRYRKAQPQRMSLLAILGRKPRIQAAETKKTEIEMTRLIAGL